MPVTEQQWIDEVLADAGDPITPNTQADLMGWLTLEEPPSQWWGGYGTAANPTRINPLNTGEDTQPSPLTGNTLAGGLGTYTSLDAAAAGTAKTIGLSYYTNNIAAALKANASPAQFFAALQASPWAGSHYRNRTFPTNVTPGPAVTNQTLSQTIASVPSLPASGAPTAAQLLAGTTTGAAGQTTTSGGSSGQITLIPPVTGPLGVTFFPGLHISTSTLTRVGLGLVGIILLFIGINALTRSSPTAGPITVMGDGAGAATEAPTTPAHSPVHHAASDAATAAVLA